MGGLADMGCGDSYYLVDGLLPAKGVAGNSRTRQVMLDGDFFGASTDEFLLVRALGFKVQMGLESESAPLYYCLVN